MPSFPVPLLSTLPPPITLHSTETLHRILLPPLAEFLTDLSAPEHLLKLHDILDRYRTPKSYHRVDVREVSSGELPWEEERLTGQTGGGTGRRTGANEEGRKGESGAEGVRGDTEKLDGTAEGQDAQHDTDGLGGQLEAVPAEQNVEGASEVKEDLQGKTGPKKEAGLDTAVHTSGRPTQSTTAAIVNNKTDANKDATSAISTTNSPTKTDDHMTEAQATWNERARGRPIILPTEADVQAYLANRDRPPPVAEVMYIKAVKLSEDHAVRVVEGMAVNGNIKELAEGDEVPIEPVAAEAVLNEAGDSVTLVAEQAEQAGEATHAEETIAPEQPLAQTKTEPSALQETDLTPTEPPALAAVPVAAMATPSTATASPSTIPHPPRSQADSAAPSSNPERPPVSSGYIPPRRPSPPKRRVRELRLDLRTLDAAALFQLEIWRREVLGLGKLDMEHPDSIWYNEPTPTPEPEEEVIEVVKKKRGRPKKVRKEEVRDEEGDTTGVREGEEGNVGVAVSGKGVEGDVTTAEGEAGVSGEADSAEKEPSADAGGDVIMEPAVKEGSSPRSPTPDDILFDAFNEKDDEDPDFVPPATPPPTRRGRGRPRKSAAAVADGIAVSDQAPSATGTPRPPDGPNESNPVPKEAGPSRSGRRGRSSTTASHRQCISAGDVIKVEVSPDVDARPSKRQRTSISAETAAIGERSLISLGPTLTTFSTPLGYLVDLQISTRSAKRRKLSGVDASAMGREQAGTAATPAASTRTLRAMRPRTSEPAKAMPINTPARRSTARPIRSTPRRSAAVHARQPTSAAFTRSRRNDVIEIADSGDEEEIPLVGSQVDELDSTDEEDPLPAKDVKVEMGIKSTVEDDDEEWGYFRCI